MGVCGIFRTPVQGGSNELISKFLSSMILYNHQASYFKSGEINSYRLSPLPNSRALSPQVRRPSTPIIVPNDMTKYPLKNQTHQLIS